MNLQLEDKRALVTGDSRGIGKAVARALALEGADIARLARDATALAATAAELTQETGRLVVGISGDTTRAGYLRHNQRHSHTRALHA